MKGLWQLPTRTLDPGVGVTIIGALVAAAVVIFTCIAISTRSRQWPEAWMLHVGMLFLSSWFVLHLIDLMIHQFRVPVKYSYILVGCLYNAIRASSDVFVLWGTWRVLIRHEEFRPTMQRSAHLFWTTIIGVLLSFLALYHLCLLFALAFAWLSFADLDVINAVAEARNGFEITFTAVQFIATLGTVVWGAVMLRDSISHYETEAILLFLATVPLFMRSFCEVVIVGQLDRSPADFQGITQARDITYGLFSTLFVVFIAFATPINGSEDPLIARDNMAVEEVMTWVLQQLVQVTENGRKTAPTMSNLLKPLEVSLGLDVANSNVRRNEITEIKRREIEKLKKRYAKWEPIYKWNA